MDRCRRWWHRPRCASSWPTIRPSRSLPGGAAVPGAGAGDEHRPPPGREARSPGRAQGQAHEEPIMPSAARPDLHGPRRGRSLWRADRRPAGGHADVQQVPGRLARQHRRRAGAAGPQAGHAHARGRRAQRPLRARNAGRRRRRREPRQDRSPTPHGAGVPRHPGPRNLPAGVLPRQLRRHGRSSAADFDSRLHRFGHRPAALGHTPVAAADLQDLPHGDGRCPGAAARAWCWTSTTARCSGA